MAGRRCSEKVSGVWQVYEAAGRRWRKRRRRARGHRCDRKGIAEGAAGGGNNNGCEGNGAKGVSAEAGGSRRGKGSREE